MSNEFLEHHDSWKAKHGQSDYGFPMLKISVGTIQFRVLDAVPTSRILHYKSVGNKPVMCPEDGCLFCARGDEATTQHYLNIVDRSDDKVKVLTYSKAASDAIAECIREVAKSATDSKLNHPRNYDIELVRTGTGKKDTRYKAVAIKRDFSPEAYTPFDLKSKLVPMPVEEQKKNQGRRDAPPASVANRPARRWEGTPPTQSTVTPEVKTVIEDDDKEV